MSILLTYGGNNKMSMCIEYIKCLLNEAFKIKYEEIEDVINNNCQKVVEELTERIVSLLDKKGETLSTPNNRFYNYVSNLKKTNNYIKVIDNLNGIKSIIEHNKTFSEQERQAIQNLNSCINIDLKCRGFSPTNLSRILGGTVSSEDKIKIFMEYLFIPLLQDNSKECTCFFIATHKFLKKNKSLAESTPYSSGYDALIMDKESVQFSDYTKYVRGVFSVLEEIDNYIETHTQYEVDIWKYFQPYIERACKNCDYVTDEVLKEIKCKSLPELVKEWKFYERVLDNEHDILTNAFFQCIGLYHISHTFQMYMNKNIDRNPEYSIVAMQLCSFAASKFKSVLHPASDIHAPCGLAGKHIFVGPGSIIEPGCYIEEQVIIAGCPQKDETVRDYFDSVTKVGEKTTIKRNAMLVAGVTVGSKCVIDEGAILVRGKVEDNQFVKSDNSKEDLWDKEDYHNKGGYNYWEESR